MTQQALKLIGALAVPLALIIAVACGGNPSNSTPATGPATTDTSASVSTSAAESSDPATVTAGSPAEKLNIVTTSNIVADWVRAIGQNRVDAFPLLPANADPHTYQPGAQDIARLADADLVFSVGLSLEGVWLDELVENAAQNPEKIVALGDVVDPIDSVKILEEHGEEEEEDGHGALDPHFWFDPLRVQQAVNSIAAQLSTADPSRQALYRDNAAAYNRELEDLHAWISEQVETLPEERRILVTSHDSFQYFAQRYGFEVVGTIFPVTTEAEPTAQDLAKLIETIEHEGVPAVFTEKSHSERLAMRVAEETGATLIGGLHTGSLGDEDGEAGSYLGLMRYNTTTMVEALR